jgi:hypothetical protein
VEASRKGHCAPTFHGRPRWSRGQGMKGIQLEIKETLLGMLSTTVQKYKGKKIPGCPPVPRFAGSMQCSKPHRIIK